MVSFCTLIWTLFFSLFFFSILFLFFVFHSTVQSKLCGVWLHWSLASRGLPLCAAKGPCSVSCHSVLVSDCTHLCLLHETCYEYEWWLLSYTAISPLLSRLTALLSCVILNEWLQLFIACFEYPPKWRTYTIFGLLHDWCRVRLLPFQHILFIPYNHVASLHAKPHT